MKKTGKVVFGVVSAAALVATGYASWSINKGFTQVSSNPISGTVTEILDNSFGKITLKKNDTTLVFDAPKKYYNGTEDLEVSYFVKAHANDGDHVNDYDPYDLTRYDLVSQDYRPYLNISAEVTDQNGDPLEDEEKLANIEKLIDLPTKVIDYHEWLGEDAKNNEDGYLVNYAIAWDQETFGGVNPQIVYDNDSSLDVVNKRAKFQEIIDTLNGVYFKLTFKVGFYGELPPEVSEEKYGVVTFEEVTNLSLKLTADGNAITSGDKLKVGTTVNVEATPSDNYHLVTLTHNGISILDTLTFNIVEGDNTILASVEKDAPVASKVVASLDVDTLKVGEKAILTVKDDLGTTLEDFEVIDLDETEKSIVEVNGNILTGLKKGKVTFKVSSKDLLASEELTLVVENNNEEPPVVVNENTFDKLNTLKANDPVVIEGRIIAVGYNGALVYDGTNFGYVLQDSKNALITSSYGVGDVIKVSGYVSVFYTNKMAALDAYSPSEVTLKVETSTLEIADPLSDMTPTEWGAEELEAYASDSNNPGPHYVSIKKIKYVKDGNYNNFTVDSFTSGSLLMGDEVALTNGAYYDIEGFVVYSTSKGSAAGFKNVVLTNYKEADVKATSVNEVKLSKTTINVGETATVTAKDDLGNDLTNITINPVDPAQDVVKIEGTTLTGLKKGEFKFKVSSGELTPSKEVSLTVKETSGTELVNALSVDFNAEPVWTTENGDYDSQYADRKLSIDGGNLIINAASYQSLGGVTQVNLGTNKSKSNEYVGVGLPAKMLSAITDTEVTSDNYMVGNNYYYGFYMDFNVEDVLKIEFKYKDYSDKFLNFYILSSNDGINWTKLSTNPVEDIVDCTISYEFNEAQEGSRFAIVMESSTMKSRRPIDSFNLYK